MQYIYMHLFLKTLIYLFYSLHIAFAHCSVVFVAKLLYTFHTIHDIICIMVHAYSLFIIHNFVFDLIDISFYASQPMESIICII